MKSKFMRMVGRGVEDPEEEEQVFQEAEQADEEHQIDEVDNALPQISDAEIDSLYEKFLLTTFKSPYIYNKRLYVLDVFTQIENFLNQTDLTKLSGGSKKRLVGGITAFDGIFNDIKAIPYLEPLLNNILDVEGDIEDTNYYNDENINTLINLLENKYKEIEINEEEENKESKLDKISELISKLKQAQLTDVSPDKDVLDSDKIKDADRFINRFGNIEFEDRFGISVGALKKLYEMKTHLGIFDRDITSGRILKSLEQFNSITDINKFVGNLYHLVVEQPDNYVYFDEIKKVGIKLSKDDENFIKNYSKGVKILTEEQAQQLIGDERFFKNGVFDRNKYKSYEKKQTNLDEKIIRTKQEEEERINKIVNPVEREKERTKSYLKEIMKKLFIDTIKNPLLGNIYFDKDGKLTKTGEQINQIINGRGNFVDNSPFNVYPYTDKKEFGNVYEYYEAMAYANKIANIIYWDFMDANQHIKIFERIRLSGIAKQNVIKHYEDALRTLKIVYGFYTGDVARIDNVIKFIYRGKEYTINIETKASGRLTASSLPQLRTIDKTMKKIKNNQGGIMYPNYKSYDLVYTGITKLALLIQEYLNGIEDKKQYTYCYNTLYYKDTTNVMKAIKTDKNFNVKPTSASILNIRKLVEELNFTRGEKEKILSIDTSKSRGRKANDEEDEEEENDEEDEDEKETVTYFYNLLVNKMKQKNFKKGHIYRKSESIYLGIPVLYALGVADSLDDNTKYKYLKDIGHNINLDAYREPEELLDETETFIEEYGNLPPTPITTEHFTDRRQYRDVGYNTPTSQTSTPGIEPTGLTPTFEEGSPGQTEYENSLNRTIEIDI